MAGRNEKKNITKSKIVNYIINNKITSKAELAQNLSLSMPTVLSNVICSRCSDHSKSSGNRIAEHAV